MKQWITLLAATALFTACSKQSLQDELQQENLSLQKETSSATLAMRSTQSGAYVSGWEQFNNWIKTDDGTASVFTSTVKTPEVAAAANGGLVLGYAKSGSTDQLYQHLTTPTMLPFYYVPASGRPLPGNYYFSEVIAGENIVLQYRMPFTKAEIPTLLDGNSLQSLQFQHVVLTKEFLDSRGLTADAVRKYYTYDQVMTLVNP
ncbi:MAG TPA: hypothetical protein VMR70_00235 [Flavisolibacter sp.]|nr:hypothetical protein [Flavisolibacter sp.]